MQSHLSLASGAPSGIPSSPSGLYLAQRVGLSVRKKRTIWTRVCWTRLLGLWASSDAADLLWSLDDDVTSLRLVGQFGGSRNNHHPHHVPWTQSGQRGRRRRTNGGHWSQVSPAAPMRQPREPQVPPPSFGQRGSPQVGEIFCRWSDSRIKEMLTFHLLMIKGALIQRSALCYN